MAPSAGNLIHLPNGQTLTVSPSFGGLFFKANDLNTHHNPFPPGWTIILHSEDEDEDHLQPGYEAPKLESDLPAQQKHHHIHRFKKPTLNHDHIFISSISNPSSSDFRPVTSPTRQIAMMLWASLWWYFHQTPPESHLTTKASASTPDAGKPRGEWRIYVNREGIFKGKHLMPKLERMGLISCEDSSVGADPDDGAGRDSGVGFQKCFISRRSFWQLDARIYLFTMAPTASPYPILSPSNSRPSSPSRTPPLSLTPRNAEEGTLRPEINWRQSMPPTPPAPFASASHLPTFYPPPPLQYTFTGTVRHPIRPKPARQGEVIYTRFIPSLDQYISFRIASLSPRPVLHRGPSGTPANAETSLAPGTRDAIRGAFQPDASITTVATLADTPSGDTCSMTDVQLLHKWMNDPRVSASWGEQGAVSHQEAFLKAGLESRHSFPVIGCFDGKPFGYFEIYWVKEDQLAHHLGGNCGDWDRGLHILVGEQEFRGAHRVKVWLSALVHYCFLADMRTSAVFMEPRVDNQKVKQYCEEAGFHKEGEVTFAHKQSNLMKIKRETWEAPAL